MYKTYYNQYDLFYVEQPKYVLENSNVCHTHILFCQLYVHVSNAIGIINRKIYPMCSSSSGLMIECMASFRPGPLIPIISYT